MTLRDGLTEAALAAALFLAHLGAAGRHFVYQRTLAGLPVGLAERAKVLDEWHRDPERQAECDDVDASG